MDGDAQTDAFKDGSGRKHDVIPSQIGQCFGMPDMLYALISRHLSNQAKNPDGDDQAPEIDFCHIAEWMLGVALALAAVMPTRSNTLLLVSTVEWIALDNMDEPPVMSATMNFVMAMAVLPGLAP